MPYCIYTDTDVPPTQGNLDHIVPLSLGGCDDFRIWASKAFNSEMGSQIDGRIANDPFVMLARREADARGHSGRPPVPVWKRTTLGGKPVQLSLAKEELSAWDPIGRRRIPEAELAGLSFETKLQIDFGAPLKFIAKLALAGAYFVYGEAFSASFDCRQLRRMLTLDLSDRDAIGAAGIYATFMSRWHPDTRPGARDIQYLCELTSRTTLIFWPQIGGMSVHVGILGMYLASMTMHGDSSDLPLLGDHDVGHVILLRPGLMERMSLRALALAAAGQRGRHGKQDLA